MGGTVHVFNGPNLNLLGSREPDIYGRATLADIEALCRAETDAAGLALQFRQSNAEAELVGWVQAARTGAAGIVINPAALSYSGYALLDALKAADCPVIEVHLSNIHARAESWRAHSLISSAAAGVITGLGASGYALAVRHITGLPNVRPA